jgi:hypothetical protein
VVGVAVAAVGGVGDDRVRAEGVDDSGDVPCHGRDIGRAQGILGHLGGGTGMTVGAPFHPRVLEDACGSAEEGVQAHPEGTHRLGDLLFADLRQTGTVAFEVFELGRDHLAALTARGGEDHDLGTLGDQRGDCASRRDRLIVGMSVHEEDAWRGGHVFLGALGARGHTVCWIRRSGGAAWRRASHVPSDRAQPCGCGSHRE